MSNKVMLVTGSSRGIGAATAKLASLKGWSVCINFHSKTNEAARVVDEITALGGTAISIQADIAIEDAFQLYKSR